MNLEKRQEHLRNVCDALDAANARDAGKEFQNHLYRHGPTPPRRFTVFTDGTEKAYSLEREAYMQATIAWVKNCGEDVEPPPLPFQNGETELDMDHVKRIKKIIEAQLPKERLEIAQRRQEAQRKQVKK